VSAIINQRNRREAGERKEILGVKEEQEEESQE